MMARHLGGVVEAGPAQIPQRVVQLEEDNQPRHTGENPVQLKTRCCCAGVIRLSRASYRKMIQNLAWAAGYNVAAIPLAAGVLAWAGIRLSPAVGAILMSVSTIVVALNAQLLRRVRLSPERASA